MVKIYTAEDITALLGRRKAKETTVEGVLLKIQKKLKKAVDGTPSKEGGRAPTKVLRYDDKAQCWYLAVKYGNKILWGVGGQAGSEGEAKEAAYLYLDELATGKALSEEQKKQIESTMKEFKERADKNVAKRTKK
jgi:hypothetical protein